MTPLEELAAKLRTFWLRDISASSASVDGSAAADGSVALARTLFIPAAGGLVGINQIPTDPYALDVVGHGRIAGNLYARAGNSWNIGADGAPWGAIYASDLHVGNLIAENKIATTGGRILVSPSTKVILAMTTGATTIDVAANTLTSGDRIYLESTGKLEWMAVTSGSTAVTGGYRYSVTRNLNGAGAQTWAAGDAVVNTGQSGQGFIDLYSRYGIPANGQTSTTRQGPTIVGNVRTGSTFDAIKERWAVGNLKGLYDYVATAYGLAAGDPTAAWFALDASNGLRMMQASATRVQLTAAGVFTINDSSGAPVFTFNASAGAEFTLPLTLGTNGGIWQGTGTFASPTTGLKIWNDAGLGRIAGYNSGVLQWYAETDGKLYAGGGNAVIDANGLTLAKGTYYVAGAALKWLDADVSIYGWESVGAVNKMRTTVNRTGAGAGAVYELFVDGGATGGGYGEISFALSGDGSSGYLYLRATGVHDLKGNLGFVGSTSGKAIITAPAVAGTPTLTLPTVTGTLALTSDITAAIVGTSGRIAKFTGTNTVGDSIITESGATLSAAGALTIVGQSDTNQLIVKSHSTQTTPQIVIQSSAAAELARVYVNAAGAVAFGYQAGNALDAVGKTIAIGYEAGLTTTDDGGVYIGYQAGKAVTANGLTPQTNVAIGDGAFQTNTDGYGCVAIGWESMKVYTGKQSIAIGDRTMWNATTGLYNFAFGEEALFSLISGHYNEAIGIQALYSNNGSGNIGVGAWALYSNASGSDNIAFGANAGFHNLGSGNVYIGGTVGYNATGDNSVFIGFEAGRTSGAATINDSVYIGYRAGYGASAGSNNVGIGSGALPKTVANATAVGHQAGNVQTGAGFTAFGYQAGLLSTSGTNSTLIGSGAGASLTTNGGCVMIGYQAGNAETGANRLYIHNSSTTTPLIYGLFSGTGAGLRITSQATDGTPLVVRGKASQSSTLQDWQDSAATVLAYVSATGKFVAATPATTTASITLPAGVAPTSPVAGDVWQDSTRKATYGFFAGITQGVVGCIFTGTADASVGNTTTDTSIMPTGIGTLTLPANFWTVGKTIRVKLWGKLTKGATSATRQYTFLLGAVTIKTNTTAASAATLTDDGWQFDCLITCRTTGATGTVYAQMKHYHYGIVDPILAGTATVTIDTTASALIDYKFKWSANDASNNMVTTNCSVEVLN